MGKDYFYFRVDNAWYLGIGSFSSLTLVFEGKILAADDNYNMSRVAFACPEVDSTLLVKECHKITSEKAAQACKEEILNLYISKKAPQIKYRILKNKNHLYHNFVKNADVMIESFNKLDQKKIG